MPKTKTTLKNVAAFRAAAKGQEDAKQDAFEGELELRTIPLQTWDWWIATTTLMSLYTSLSVADVRALVSWVAAHRGAPSAQPPMIAAMLAGLHSDSVGGGGPGNVERQRVDAWLNEAKRLFGLTTVWEVNGLVVQLRQRCTKKTLPKLWPTLGVALQLRIKDLRTSDGFPLWLPRAILHCESVAASDFWMLGFVDIRTIHCVAEKIYADTSWSSASTRELRAALNKFVRGLRHFDIAQCRQFLGILSFQQWRDLLAAWQLLDADNNGKSLRRKVMEVRALVSEDAERKGVGKGTTATATNADLGEWFVHYRELTLKLIHLGYSTDVIAEMYKQGLKYRDMLKLTWFHGAPSAATADVAIKVGAKNNRGQLEPEHGHYFANTKHLADRHLYQHFKFDATPDYPGDDPIKYKNSFHPHGTTQGDLARMTDNLVLEKDKETHTARGLLIGIKLDRKRIKTLFPDLQTNHLDFFWDYELERMKCVAALFPEPFCNKLPEIPWAAAPREDRAQ